MSNVGNSVGAVAALYGTDLYNVGGLDPDMREVTGPFLVVQSCVNRLNMKRGGCIDCPNDGLDLASWLGGDVKSAAQLAQIQPQIISELRKDQRVFSASITSFSYSPTTSTMSISIQIVTALGPFTMTLSVSSVTTTLLSTSASP